MANESALFHTNFSQGEISDYVESRVDVAKRANGARVIENFWPMPEGGVIRRPGTKFICEVKDSSKFTLAIPFEYSTTDAFVVEAAHQAFRFIKNRAQVVNGPTPVEVASPYVEADLRDIHYEQSNDFLFMTSINPAIDVQKLARVTDTSWTLADFNAQPSPSFDADESLGVVGAPSANTGAAVTWAVGSNLFLAGDVGRQIIAGSGRGVITAIIANGATVRVLDPFSAVYTAGPATLISSGATVTSTAHGISANQFVVLTSGAQSGEIRQVVSVTNANVFVIDSAFSSDQSVAVTWNKTSGIAAGQWVLRLAPQATLQVSQSSVGAAVGTRVRLDTNVPALRTTYLNKIVKLFGGAVELTNIIDSQNADGQIMSPLTDMTTHPSTAAVGAWRLQESSWTTARGRPRTLRVHQGRLVFAGTLAQPNTIWAPALNDIYNFATGALPTDPWEYTFSGGKQNPIQWLVSLGSLFIGDAKREHSAKGQGIDAPIGGDETPFVKKLSEQGSMHAQAITVDNAIVALQRFEHDVVQFAYSLQDSADGESFVPTDLTDFARQIGEMEFALHAPVYYQKPYSIVFHPLKNGQLAGLTFKPRQEVKAWARTKTDGEIESVAVVPHENGRSMTVYLIVKRIINGVTKRYWEYFEDNSSTVSARGWSSLQTDCAKVGTLLAGATTITGLSHLEGKTIDVVIGRTAIAPKLVTGGVVTLDVNEAPEADTYYEAGLHYDSTLTTVRPAIPGQVTEGFKRAWPVVFARLKNTIGGKLNGLPLKQKTSARMFSGLATLENVKTADDYDGALTFTQTQPYPMTIINVSGRVQFADKMA